MGPCMAYNSIRIKPYIKSHLELQREITLIKLAPSPYFFVLKICLAYMYMFARFNENPAMTLQDIKETKRYGRTDARTDARTHGRTDNVKTVYPLQTKFAGGIKMKVLEWSQHFSHCKSMGIFPDAQGQLTHKSLVNLAEIWTHLRFYGCPCYLQE